MAKDTFFGAGLFLVAPSTADQRVKAKFIDRFEQSHRLVHITAFARMGQAHGTALYRVLYRAHDKLRTQFLRALITELRDFGKIVTGVNHQQGIGQPPFASTCVLATKGFFCALK